MPSSLRTQAIRDLTQLVMSRSGADNPAVDRAIGIDTKMRRATERLLDAFQSKVPTTHDERTLSRVFDRLLSVSLDIHVGPPFDSRPWTDTFRCLRDLLAMRILMAYGYNGPSKHVTVRLLGRARRSQFTAVEIMCLFYVRASMGLQGKLGQVRKLNAEISALEHVYALELEAEGWEDISNALVVSHRGADPLTIRQIEAMGRKAEALRHNYDRWVFHATAFRLRSRALQLRDDWHGALAVCDEAVQYYQGHPDFSSPSRMGEFVLRSMVCLTHLNDLRGAKRRSERARPMLATNIPMWNVVLEYMYAMGVRSCDLVYASSVCLEARSYQRRALTQARRDFWKLREVALHVFARFFPATQSYVQSTLGPSRMYIANVERRMAGLTADKLVTNAQLLYLRVLYYIDMKKYSDIVELRDSIGLYIKRHLLGASTQRTATFFRMLMRLPSHDFNADCCERACAHFVDRLQTLPIGAESAELIPYDVLWRAVLDVLRRNATDTRRRR
jgi:hypothetical protein